MNNIPNGPQDKPTSPLASPLGVHADAEKHDLREARVKSLAIVGVVGLLAIGIWGTVQVVQIAPKAFANISSAVASLSLSSIFTPGERIEFSMATTTVASGKKVDLAWNHISKKNDGSYAFMYHCREGVTFKAMNLSNQETVVACNIPFSFMTGTSTLSVTPLSTVKRTMDVPVFILFTENGENEPSERGETTLTIVNTSIAEEKPAATTTATTTNKGGGTKPTPITKPTTTPAKPSTGSNGGASAFPVADLGVRVVATGYLDRVTGAFTPASSISVNDRGAIRFEIINLGTKASGEWDFSAVLPTLPQNIYFSPKQASLSPGDRIEFTLGFDSVTDRTNIATVTLNVDPSHLVNERTEANNVASQLINIRK